MRFKIFYNEKDSKLNINCLSDNHSDIILPENPDQHVYFPIPDELKDDIKKELLSLISDEDLESFENINDNIKLLLEQRKEMIHNIRKRTNPLIIEKCEEFKLERAEDFI